MFAASWARSDAANRSGAQQFGQLAPASPTSSNFAMRRSRTSYNTPAARWPGATSHGSGASPRLPPHSSDLPYPPDVLDRVGELLVGHNGALLRRVPRAYAVLMRDDAIAAAGGGSTIDDMGLYSYEAATNAWNWSDGLYTIHGYEPGEVKPTTQLLLTHKHPADRPRAADLLATCQRTGKPFCYYHRIVDTHEQVRYVVVAGDGTVDTTGVVLTMRGYCIDLTGARRREIAAEVSAAIARSAEHRGTIEQAKGALMLAYGIDSEVAFALLVRHSQQHNLKLNEICRRLVIAIGHQDIAAPQAAALGLRIATVLEDAMSS